MKKIFVAAFALTLSANLFAQEAPAPQEVACTIVCSPCDKVPNTLIKGEATKEQIKEAQEKMLKDCGM